MKQRFSGREVALLMVPVLAVGAWGWWVSKRPTVVADEGRLSLSFEVAKPTMLEAFEGWEGAFVVKVKDREGTEHGFRNAKPSLELDTGQGVKVSSLDNRVGFWREVWGNNRNNSRFCFKMGSLPPGKLRFGFDGMANPLWTQGPALPPPLVRLQGKWEVDRSLIAPLHLAAQPHQPWVVVRSVKIIEVNLVKKPRPGDPITVKGEVIFDLQQEARNAGTSFDSQFDARAVPHRIPEGNEGFSPNVSWGSGGLEKPSVPETDDMRLLRWEVGMDEATASEKVQVAGRASAGERWPLGFEIEPFRATEVKVGQTLAVKSFALALPR